MFLETGAKVEDLEQNQRKKQIRIYHLFDDGKKIITIEL